MIEHLSNIKFFVHSKLWHHDVNSKKHVCILGWEQNIIAFISSLREGEITADHNEQCNDNE